MSKAREHSTTTVIVKRARTPEEAEALIRRLDADREAIMHGHDLTGMEDSVEILRQMREERLTRLTSQ